MWPFVDFPVKAVAKGVKIQRVGLSIVKYSRKMTDIGIAKGTKEIWTKMTSSSLSVLEVEIF